MQSQQQLEGDLKRARRLRKPEQRELGILEARLRFEERESLSPFAHYPGLPDSVRRVRDGFFALDGDRHIAIVAGMGGGQVIYRPIPYTALARWADDHGFDVGSESREELEDLIGSMDRAFLTHHNARKG